MKRCLLVFASFIFVFAVKAHTQACAQIGISCPHPTTQQRPAQSSQANNGNNSADNDDRQQHYQSARAHYADGYAALDQFFQNHAPATYSLALYEFNQALAKVKNYGPALYGLCQLYERNNEYDEARVACETALKKEQRDDFGDPKGTRKDIKERIIPRLNIEIGFRLYDGLEKKWTDSCGLHTWSSAGGTVDPSFNVAERLDYCIKSHAENNKFKASLDKQQTDYKKKYP